MGSVEPLIEIQTNYNRAREQVIENADLIANPKWMIPKTAGLASGALGSKAGEKVFYNAAGGPAPHPVSMPSLPSYVLSNVQQLASEMLLAFMRRLWASAPWVSIPAGLSSHCLERT
jgi:hypothetical protein